MTIRFVFRLKSFASISRTSARVLLVPPAVIWSRTWWQQVVLNLLWSRQPANCRWSRTGPSATRPLGPRRTWLRSNPRSFTSPSGQVSFSLQSSQLLKFYFLLFGRVSHSVPGSDLCRWCQAFHGEGASGGGLPRGSVLPHGLVLFHEWRPVPPEDAGQRSCRGHEPNHQQPPHGLWGFRRQAAVTLHVHLARWGGEEPLLQVEEVMPMIWLDSMRQCRSMSFPSSLPLVCWLEESPQPIICLQPTLSSWSSHTPTDFMFSFTTSINVWSSSTLCMPACHFQP